MKRKLYRILAASSIVIGILLTTSCEKKTVTQEDVINQQQLVNLILHILDASSDDNLPLDSAVVTVTAEKENIQKVTDGSGIVSFEDVPIGGNIPVKVTKNNYTSINTTVNTNPADFRQSVVYATLNLYSLADSLITTIKGIVTVESDVTNREPEAIPVGSVVKAFNDDMVGSRTAFIGTTDTNGIYEIKVPAHSDGTDDIRVIFPDLVLDQTVALELEEDGTFAIEQRESYFTLNQNAEFGAIPDIPSAWATIEAPAASMGSGFALDADINPTLLNASSLNVIVTNGGSGYPNGYSVFDCSAGGNGLSAQIAFYGENGALSKTVAPFYIDNGALYTSAPTIDLNFGGSGAQVSTQFMTTYDISISNGGSNYVGFPIVYGQAQAYENDLLVTVTDDNIDDVFDGYFGWDVLDNTDIDAGVIISVSGYGDTISTTQYLASEPTFGISFTPKAQPAELSVNISANDSIVSSISIDNNGSNYDPTDPPEVTINSLSGFGSGATAVAEVNSQGVVSAVEMTNLGSGYVQNVNDFTGDGVTWDYEEQPSPYLGGSSLFIYNVIPGNMYFQNAHYGTGTPTDMD